MQGKWKLSIPRSFSKEAFKSAAFAMCTLAFSNLAASASEDEGVTDYAKAEKPAKAGAVNRCVPFMGKYDSLAERWGPEYTVKAGDIIEVKLMQAFVRDFPTTHQWFKSTSVGSLAIVANVAELSPIGTASPEDFNFNPSSATSGRLVYYSDNVTAEQALNLSQLPVYGPITYHGRPLALTIHVFALNVNNQQINSVLKSLASAGSLAYPPASAVLNLLETLGTNLVQSREAANSVLTYRFLLVPKGPQIPGVDAGLLEYGTYVLRRLENRTRYVAWSPYLLDASTGLLYGDSSKTGTPSAETDDESQESRQKKGDDSMPCVASSAFKDDTFLSIQINKASEAVALDSNADLDSLIAKLQTIDASKAENIDAIAANISSVVKGNQTVELSLQQLDQYFQGDRSSTIKSQVGNIIDAAAASVGTAGATAISKIDGQNASPLSKTQVQKVINKIAENVPQYSKRFSVASFDATCVKQYILLNPLTSACQ